MEWNFAQNPTVDSIDKVPETFRGLYVQDGEAFKVNDAFTGVATAIDGLSKSLKASRTEATDAKKKAVDVDALVKAELGIEGGLEAAKTKFTELTEAVAKKSNVDPAKIKADIEATFVEKENGYKTQLQNMQGTLETYLIDSQANAALAEHKGNPKLLMPIIKQSTKVVEEDGKYVVRVLDDEGQYRGDGKGGFMGPVDFVAELKKSADYGAAFTSDTKQGGQPQNRQAPASRQTTQSQANNTGEKSSIDKISSGLQNRQH